MYVSDLFLTMIANDLTSYVDHIKEIFHALLFNIKNYSSEIINIQRREACLKTILPRVNICILKKQKHVIFVLLYPTNTKHRDLGRQRLGK